MFLYVGAEQRGDSYDTLISVRENNPALGALVLAEVASGDLGQAARSGAGITDAFAHIWELVA